MATKDEQALQEDLTSTQPEDPGQGGNYPLGKNLTGTVGQFMGDPSTYSPDQTQLREGAQQFHNLTSAEWESLTDAQKQEAIKSYVSGEKASGVNFSQPTVKKAEKATPKPASSSTSQALADIQKYLTSQVAQGEEAFGVEGQQLAAQNQAVTGTVDQFLTGTDSGSAAVNAAQDAYAKAYSAGEGLNSAAYANMGAANAQYVAAAPEQAIVNLLTQGLGSGQYKELPTALVAQLPQSVREALSSAGITESTGTGVGNPIPTTPTVKGAASSNLSSLLTNIENTGATGVANPNSGINTANLNPSNVTG